MHILDLPSFEKLFTVLKTQEYQIIGPTLRDKTIVCDEITSASDLPAGWGDQQEAGRYRVHQTADKTFFGYVVGPQSWKKYLYPPRIRLWEAKKNGSKFKFQQEAPLAPRMAFVGVHPCDLSAISILDRVLMKDAYVDPFYKARRSQNFIVAVNCLNPASTCFCASMNTGPRAKDGYDLLLTEIVAKKTHYFLAESGSDAGAAVLAELAHRQATAEEIHLAETLMAEAAQKMTRRVDTEALPELLAGSLEHARWENVGHRCLNCSNCTMVCPTCFCTTVDDVTDLTGSTTTRERRWDSCFTADFSYIHGGHVRTSPMSRYRQWLTHKFGNWVAQFDTFGCVGCGRCITWCPVGIDVTEELAAIRDSSDALIDEHKKQHYRRG